MVAMGFIATVIADVTESGSCETPGGSDMDAIGFTANGAAAEPDAAGRYEDSAYIGYTRAYHTNARHTNSRYRTG